MNLRQRIELLGRLGEYMQSPEPSWLHAKEEAYIRNNWFTGEFIDRAVREITRAFLNPDLLEQWAARYSLKRAEQDPKNVGIVMAGNIPLVGFHDFLCVFTSGHSQTIKSSSKDNVLIPHLTGKLLEWAPELSERIRYSERLAGSDAYIATGSNNSSRYFEYYFSKYPSIIRRNRTSVAILNGEETSNDLEKLADDVQLYFGLGCRNVTKLYVPEGYDFIPVLDALRKYQYFFEHNKYKNNYDYQLAIYIMNSLPYMTNDSIVLLENKTLFSPIGTLYYEYYPSQNGSGSLLAELSNNPDVQCIIGKEALPFGGAQSPRLEDYADGVDTMEFLSGL
jgi:hypothetical protein